ncbi:4Fe-4S binding domain-containing protein [Peptoniphilus asaccharolyticus DSM 20463]|uniref:4Fe-4S binding domain-containing protein n=1 Tax=Peptoniphilus asaccharolyticus DSM 20463 TaxID=573058 RepID=A0A1W1UC50_PEPAS|nr:hypothetical protein [Peptoniphilus asaccharolyticus]MBL7576418.1 hypothetical protein [Peptoniphilus asaccharolyticus]SMB78675.1 4Fe-4S binding domain-containing protein [Peptoniphilus asaccharolyticus DSM 20463]
MKCKFCGGNLNKIKFPYKINKEIDTNIIFIEGVLCDKCKQIYINKKEKERILKIKEGIF